MKSTLCLLVLLVPTFLCAGEPTLKEVKNSTGSKRYLEYTIPESESAGTYKIWNLTQNKQVGSNIQKTSGEKTDLILIDGNAGDKYTILNSSGDVLATLVDGVSEAKGTEISGTRKDPDAPSETAKTSGTSKKDNKRSTGIFKSLQTADGSNASMDSSDQISYIRALRTSQQVEVQKLRDRLYTTKKRLASLLKDKSESNIKAACSNSKSAAKNSANQSVGVAYECTDLNYVSNAETKATANLDAAIKYEKEVTKELQSSSAAVAAAVTSAALKSNPAAEKTPDGCSSKAMIVDYAKFNLFSNNCGRSDSSMPMPDSVSVASGSRRNSNGLSCNVMTSLEYPVVGKNKFNFVDQCYSTKLLDESHFSTFSLARVKYRKVNGERQAAFFCENGAVSPSPSAPFDNFIYRGSELGEVCPNIGTRMLSEAGFCTNPVYDDYSVNKSSDNLYEMSSRANLLKGDIFPADFTSMGKMTSTELPAVNDPKYAEYFGCKVGSSIFTGRRAPIFQCNPGPAASRFKFMGMGKATYTDATNYYKGLAPLSGKTFDQVLSGYKTCSELGIDLDSGFNQSKDKSLDGIFASTTSNEEFKVEEQIETEQFFISSQYRGGHYRALVRKNANGSFEGHGLDYPGSCVEIVPLDLKVEKVSSNEIKILHTVKEDNCNLKAGSTYTVILKRK